MPVWIRAEADLTANCEWYLEYRIFKNRPGLLGDIASLLGVLSINILTINGVEDRRRGMLLSTHNQAKIDELKQVLQRIDDIEITALRPPEPMDKLAIRHGRYLDRYLADHRTYRFTRDELGLLVDFMAELFKMDMPRCIGMRGMPRVGKTESIVAASVCASKRWVFVSSTLLYRTVRSQLSLDEMSEQNVYIIDGAVSATQTNESHDDLIRGVLRMRATKVIEHPDVFVANSGLTMDDFDYIIELRTHPEEVIDYEMFRSGLDPFLK